MKSVIMYKGKYGATRQYAEWLGAALHLPLKTPEELAEANIKTQDCIIMGSSVYIGKLLIRNWVKEHEAVLKSKKLILFVVCGSNNPKEQEKIIQQNIPDGLVDPSRIFFLPGRLIKSKLSWKDGLMLRMGAMMVKNPEIKKAMLQDRDDVKKENMNAIVSTCSGILGADSISL